MSSALSLGKGLASPMREITVFFSVLTTKLPLPGFTGLMDTLAPLAFTADSIFAARVLNAFQDLHASMRTPPLGISAVASGSALAAGFLATPPLTAVAFFLAGAFLGAMVSGVVVPR